MGQQVNATAINDVFNSQLDTVAGKEKISAFGGAYVRDRLREVSFARQVIPPEPITKADCQRSVHHDTLVKVVDIEPQSRAVAITFRGQPRAVLIRAPRAEIPFFTVSSEKFEKYEQELLAYEMPITKIIEDNSVKDIQEIEDREFLIHIEAAVQAVQQEANGGTVTPLNATTVQAGSVVEESVRKGELARQAEAPMSAVCLPMQAPDIVNLKKLLSRRRLRAERMLITDFDFADVEQWTVEDLGSKLQSETVVDGYKYSLLKGLAFVRTVKTDILRPGNVYGFTRPEFLGKFYILNNVKFYIDKIANLITWQSWEDIAIGILNIASIRKIELYSGDASTHNEDSILTSVTPVSEEDLGAVNNRVDQGLAFPQIVSY